MSTFAGGKRIRAAGAWVAIVALLAACGHTQAPAATATPGGLISRAEALAAAQRVASTSRPELSGPLVTPEASEAELTTLAEAQAALLTEASGTTGFDPATPVWLVRLEGLWANGATAPQVTPPPTQALLRHYAIILDAQTGLEIQTVLTP